MYSVQGKAGFPLANSGFTLIEALITAIIFSVGLLALVSLQMVSKRTTYEAVQRNLAAEMVNDLIEQMRMNVVDNTPPLLSPITYLAKEKGGTVTMDSSTSEDFTCDADDSQCDPGAVTSGIANLSAWFNRLAGATETRGGTAVGGLADPTVCIAGPVAAGGYDITVVWRGQTQLANASANSCGANSGKYGANSEYRRILEVTAYVENT
jgi:type IV pilus assembly protein PilV